MKEIDDTTPTEINECEDCARLSASVSLAKRTQGMYLDSVLAVSEALQERIESLERQVANLEARKPPQDTNQDPEWH